MGTVAKAWVDVDEQHGSWWQVVIDMARLTLDKGVHVSISSISDPQSSSSASELTSFVLPQVRRQVRKLVCCVLFGCKDLVQDTLYCATYAVVVYCACLT